MLTRRAASVSGDRLGRRPTVQLALLDDSRFSAAFVLTGHMTKNARRNKNAHTAARIKIATWCGVVGEGRRAPDAALTLRTINAYFCDCGTCVLVNARVRSLGRRQRARPCAGRLHGGYVDGKKTTKKRSSTLQFWSRSWFISGAV